MKKIALSLCVYVCATGFGQAQDNPNQILQREFFLKTAKSVKVEIDCPLGHLGVKTSDQGPLAVLDLKNSLRNFEYKVSYRESGGEGELRVGGSGGSSPEKDIESFSDFKKLFGIGEGIGDTNNWRIMLKEAKGLPYDLDLEMGLGDADVELGALEMTDLRFNCGLSEATLALNAPNPRRMNLLKVDNGMGSFNGKLLGNGNFEDMTVSVGMGSATLDLRGYYTDDADIKVDVGMGSIKLMVPNNMDVEVTVNSSPFSSVNLIGLVQESKTRYRSQNMGSGRYKLDFNINVGMGSVDLELVDPTD